MRKSFSFSSQSTNLLDFGCQGSRVHQHQSVYHHQFQVQDSRRALATPPHHQTMTYHHGNRRQTRSEYQRVPSGCCWHGRFRQAAPRTWEEWPVSTRQRPFEWRRISAPLPARRERADSRYWRKRRKHVQARITDVLLIHYLVFAAVPWTCRWCGLCSTAVQWERNVSSVLRRPTPRVFGRGGHNEAAAWPYRATHTHKCHMSINNSIHSDGDSVMIL